MKRKEIFYFIFGLSIVALVVLSACNEFPSSPKLYNPNASFAAASVITGVSPVNTAVAGVKEITITGRFTNDPAQTMIWFGSEAAVIKRMSVTADTVVVYRPIITGAVTLKSENLQADSMTGLVSYNLESPIRSSDVSVLQPSGSALSTVEANRIGTSLGDTLWLGTKNYITMLLPDGVTYVTYRNGSYFPAKVNGKKPDYYNVDFKDMKFGPGGYLYFTATSSPTIYKVDTTVASPVAYVTLAKPNPTIFDFNSNGDIYYNGASGTGGGGLFLVKKGTTTSVADPDYTGLIFNGLRVYNGYVYVVTSTSIFRSPINADGSTLGSKDPNPVVSLSIAAVADSTIKNSTISSFSIGSDGTILVSLSNNANYSLYVLQNDGTLKSYYYNNVLPTAISKLVWGTGRYLYMLSGTKLYQMGIANSNNAPLSGAPYLGRGL